MTALLKTIAEGSSQAERLHWLFQGAESHHGTHGGRLALVEPGEKINIRSVATTVYEPVTPDLWERHLAGERSLGICPLRADDTCLFGAIDLDDRQTDHGELVNQVKAAGLPLVVCRSKSGGAHLYVFLSEPIPAADLQRRLGEFSSALSFPPKTEIFPKQTCTANIDKAGGWINMPYFDVDATATRYAVKDKGLEATVDEFLYLAEHSTVTPDELMAIRGSSPVKASGRNTGRADAPTEEEFEKLLARWMQTLADAPNGTRDNTLMQVARDIGSWRSVIEIDSLVVQRRVQEVWQRLGKPEDEFHAQYHHNVATGQKQGNPRRLTASSNRGENGDRTAQIEKIVILTGGEEMLWRVIVAGYGDITLPSKFVWRNDLFNQRCAEELQVGFRRVKDNEWADRLNAALEVAETEALPREETVEGVLFENLQAFCLDRHRAEVIEEILLRKPFTDDDAARIYFRFRDFHGFLRDGRDGVFKGMTMHSIGKLLRGIGREGVDLGKTTKNLKGKITELYWVRSDIFQGADAARQVPLPKIQKEPI